MEGGVYPLSGNTGTLRYMAPEVAKDEPYNTSADVYSFAILLWQICSLETPFCSCTVKTHYESVIRGGYRPEIDPSWSSALSTIMTKGWSVDMSERPDCHHIMKTLRSEVYPFFGEEGLEELDESSRTAASMEKRRK